MALKLRKYSVETKLAQDDCASLLKEMNVELPLQPPETVIDQTEKAAIKAAIRDYAIKRPADQRRLMVRRSA